MRLPHVSRFELLTFIHHLHAQLCDKNKPQTEREKMAITIAQEIEGIQTAVNALLATPPPPPPPTESFLTPTDQAALDALATSVKAPTSTSS